MDNEIERKVVLHAGVSKDEIFHVFESKSNSQNKKTGSEGHAVFYIYIKNIDIQEDFIDMDDEEINQTYQMFEFVTVPSFVSLYSGNLIEPLYFVELTGKGVAKKDMSDPYGHFISKDEKYFEGLYLKLERSRNANIKRFSKLPTRIVISPDEIYDSYVDINENLEIDMNLYNMLLRKASC